jgi:SAM-dependent methyltransferase
VNPWLDGTAPRGADYDERWAKLEASGTAVHGEADLLASLSPRAVLDAGCGTGRVAIELARRGIEVCGVDLDARMLDRARAKAPGLRWVVGDLAADGFDLGRRFDVVVAAGNVMIFLTPGTEAAAVGNLARCLAPAGSLVVGFQLRAGGLTTEHYDALAAAAGLTLVHRCATWDGHPFAAGGDYAVSLHRPSGDLAAVE